MPSSLSGAGIRAPESTRAGPLKAPEQCLLGDGELLVGQDAVLVQVAELAQTAQERVRVVVSGGSRWRGRFQGEARVRSGGGMRQPDEDRGDEQRSRAGLLVHPPQDQAVRVVLGGQLVFGVSEAE